MYRYNYIYIYIYIHFCFSSLALTCDEAQFAHTKCPAHPPKRGTDRASGRGPVDFAVV